MRIAHLLLCVALMCAGSASGQQRFLPEKGERGRLGEQQPLPMVKIGSHMLRLAPGAVIYDQQNRSILHTQLPPGADVYFTRDTAGDVSRVYILTDQERARLAAGKR